MAPTLPPTATLVPCNSIGVSSVATQLVAVEAKAVGVIPGAVYQAELVNAVLATSFQAWGAQYSVRTKHDKIVLAMAHLTPHTDGRRVLEAYQLVALLFSFQRRDGFEYLGDGSVAIALIAFDVALPVRPPVAVRFHGLAGAIAELALKLAPANKLVRGPLHVLVALVLIRQGADGFATAAVNPIVDRTPVAAHCIPNAGVLAASPSERLLGVGYVEALRVATLPALKCQCRADRPDASPAAPGAAEVHVALSCDAGLLRAILFAEGTNEHGLTLTPLFLESRGLTTAPDCATKGGCYDELPNGPAVSAWSAARPL